MYCKRCGNYLPDDAVMCDICGEMAHRDNGDLGVRSMRQGRRGDAPPQVLPDEKRDSIPEYGDYEMSPLPPEQKRNVRRMNTKKSDGLSRPDTRSGVPVHGSMMTRYVTTSRKKAKGMQYHRFNWMLLLVVIAAVLAAAVAGYFVYMKVSDQGQRITARKRVLMATEETLELAATTDNLLLTEQEDVLDNFLSVPAQTYWLVGQDYESMGDMELAIKAFRIADILDPENYDGLYLLATVYELNTQNDLAEAVYMDLITNISPSRYEAYTALITLLISEGRDPEAADLMLLAYENTGRETYRIQREDFIPETPEVNAEQTAGRYELAQNIEVTSPQGYDIYYTLDDDAVLPEDGILLTGGSVLITEGTFTLRAVCVVGDLHSDELSAQYIVYYPSPAAPKANLAPGTYSKLRSVNLRAGAKSDNYKEKTEEQQAKEDDLTFYYTFDGSDPDPDISPIYDGTAIDLPTGRVTLKAIVINGYGKESSTLEIGYKFTVSPYLPDPYSNEDTFQNCEIEDTQMDAFIAAFGEPDAKGSIQYLYYEGQAQQLTYSWGTAVFTLSGNLWELASVDMTRNISTPPRGVGVGNTLSEITAAFKDFGMPDNQDGSRNLYYADPDIGKILINDDGTRIIQYTTETLSSNVMQLQYYIDTQGVCYRIVNYSIE
ncbi:MAG TPA: chitobiase/beta-hexosaminidase C-terminal domain-containing protein [Candidatus Limiplasma sp.]|nr:chitobiase/beta-hexosaminidase C-terminal domain-containing protein [Candidatus Limiplasma sp.]